MEPLLRGESSGGLRNRSRGIVRRSDAITYGSNYEKAAALIDLVRSSNSTQSTPFHFLFPSIIQLLYIVLQW